MEVQIYVCLFILLVGSSLAATVAVAKGGGNCIASDYYDKNSQQCVSCKLCFKQFRERVRNCTGSNDEVCGQCIDNYVEREPGGLCYPIIVDDHDAQSPHNLTTTTSPMDNSTMEGHESKLLSSFKVRYKVDRV